MERQPCKYGVHILKRWIHVLREWWSDKVVDENFPEQEVSVRKKQSNELVHSKSAQQGTNALETANKLLFNSEELF